MNSLSFRLTLFLSLVLLSACSATGNARKPAEREDIRLMEAQVSLPPEINKLAITERRIYEDPAAGVQYRYTGDLVYYVDVFVYPLQEAQKPLLIESKEEELVTGEIGHFHAEMNHAVEQGWYQSVQPLNDSLHSWTIEYSAGGKPRITSFLVAQSEYEVQKDGVDLASYLALSEFNGYFVKMRITHPIYPGLAEEADSFARSLYHSLYAAQSKLPIISMGKDENRVEVACRPGESMIECLGRGMRRMAPGAADDGQSSQDAAAMD